ncbi:hypothetical protein J421_1077 [Gemmatirosa kalamazoonensis]|uniref:SnoaL-like domain-containing protein n=1 Tax=Gemmatirosa kalamazoonensis TaxID=861299 RepID=W0RBY6_9BACT|nr:SgcJ/EcaC family oxidoreductase [Gemmatirosa kalamazoonensis]AHG88614.1 hypothetical protein J421_1077 [Gemmatirosa kalamazoonensis]
MADDAIDLYTRLLDAWNRRDARAFGALFVDDGRSIGFDGSLMEGRAAITDTLAGIFADHPTATYVARVRAVTSIDAHTVLLHAVVGMVPRGGTALNPAVHAVQTVVITTRDGTPRLVQLQNTPAAYHGRPEASEALTRELDEVRRSGSIVVGP